jgi:hypothetical protein
MHRSRDCAVYVSQSLGGQLEFYDVGARKSFATVEHMQVVEVLTSRGPFYVACFFLQATGLSWDPSGRMVATYKTQPLGGEVATRETVENGYMLWTFQVCHIFYFL